MSSPKQTAPTRGNCPTRGDRPTRGNRQSSGNRQNSGIASLLVLALLATTAEATLPPWLQHIVGASSLEAALFRNMPLPASVQALYPRPPKESQAELAGLITGTPDDTTLYNLRAQSDESALDFPSAEADWKAAVAHSKDPAEARLQLADYYNRRQSIPQELATLKDVAAAPAAASERFVDPAHQRSWLAFDRLLALAADQGLPSADTASIFNAFVSRYPAEPAVYAQFLTWQLAHKLWPEAETTIARYRKAFPADTVFPLRATALLAYRRGDVDRALAVYDAGFQPLEDEQLTESYFGLLAATRRDRAFVAAARARLAAHPDGPEALNALARIFLYDQQAGRLDKAQSTLTSFRLAREARGGKWTPDDLNTLAALSGEIHAYAEEARYEFALSAAPGNLPDGEPAVQAGLAGLIDLLLSVPDQPLALGAGNLSMYRDIATLDQGPGYWNGILSLWLNGSNPETEYNAEDAKAQSYFHRSKAAELLAELDRRFPAAPERAGLHVGLIRTYAALGESAAVIASGRQFLAENKDSGQRLEIAGLTADAYAREKNTAAEFALYDSLLAELAAKTNGLPLTSAVPAKPTAHVSNPFGATLVNPDAPGGAPEGSSTPDRAADTMKAASYELTSPPTFASTLPEAAEYTNLLDRYLGRLVTEKQVPQALTVLRRQLDVNPNDPLLYEKLATFLQQNSLSEQQEAIYRQAAARFADDPGWYARLARLYLKEKNRESYAAVTRQVTDIFAGTDLDNYFAENNPGFLSFSTPANASAGAQFALQLNLYASKRFPHDLAFTRNLLLAYRTKPTANPAAYEALLRRHWWEGDDLRAEFFSYLARTNKLQPELTQLASLGAPATGLRAPSIPISSAWVGGNPAAARELAEIHLWTSHFEAAAPIFSQIVTVYPADGTTGDQAISLFRSLAYLDPTPASTQRAAAIESNLLLATPGDAERLSTLGDLYAESTATGGEDLRTAAPIWRRIPTLHPGSPAGYLTTATLFWDYFQFPAATAELTAARTRFHQPTLYGYEAGAILENQHDLSGAVREYTAVATLPPDTSVFLASLNGAIDALNRAPSDAADSNLRSTTQSLFNAAAARDRLLQLAKRPNSAAFVNRSTAAAVAEAPTPAALTLRADVLLAQHRAAELPALLEAALTRAKTVDEAAAIGDLARSHSNDSQPIEANLQQVAVYSGNPAPVDRQYAGTGGYRLTVVYEHVLEREIALAPDPTEKIELSYQLSSSLESHKDIPAATRVVAAVYAANPRLLGVVRATTDFYARTNQAPRAIATLLDASKAATPTLGRTFLLEAADKSNEAGDTKQARALAEPLLKQTPYDPTVLGILAASYARANDDAGLKAFYLAQLASVRTAPLSSDERKADTALLRRGLIPALTRLKDYEGGTAEYIALLSAFPEDSATAQQAALYALRYSRKPQLLTFLRTTVQQSPRDSRFQILLADVDTTFDDLPGAVAAYSAAIGIRKDRTDLYSARADLELRLGQSDPAQMEAAAQDFDRLYVLSYRDPSWQVRLGELRARQGRAADAVNALNTAWVTGQTANPANNFKVAAQLADWNLLSEAEIAAEQGRALAGPRLLTSANAGAGATYARILTRLGKPAEALGTLTAAQRAANALPFPAQRAADFAEQGISAKDIAADRQSYLQTQRDTAEHELDAALLSIGTTVQTFYTPEQKLTYAQALDKLHVTSPTVSIAAADAAGLFDREAEWQKARLLTGAPAPANPALDAAYRSLQNRRLLFADEGKTLEAYAARVPADTRSSVLKEAADAYRDAGDETAELRITRRLTTAAAPNPRLFDLLLRRDRPGLIALAGSSNEALADAAASYAVAHATLAQALAAIAARGRSLDPVWRSAASALVLTSFATSGSAPNPPALAVFTQALAYDAPISARVSTPAGPDRQLTGPDWFFGAARFGMYLAAVKTSSTPAADAPDPQEFLPAELESNPTAPAPYLHLARNLAEGNNLPASIAEYLHALELAPNNPAVHDEFAVVLYRANRRDEALAQWHLEFALLGKRQTGEEFFSTFRSAVAHLHDRNLYAQFRPDIDLVLRPYFAHNGNYRSNEILQAIYTGSPTPAEGTAAILTASGYGPDPSGILEDLRRATWLAPESREALLLQEINLQRNKPKADLTDTAPQGMRGYQADLVSFYLDRNEVSKAQAVQSSIERGPGYNTDTDAIVIAVRSGRLPALLAAWNDQPEKLPEPSAIDSALYHLRKPTAAYKPDESAIRPLEEFVFAERDRTDKLRSTDFLALAQSRLATGDLPGALQLLRRLSLRAPGTIQMEDGTTAYASSTPTLYSNTDYAAALLETTHHEVEAIPFLQSLAQSVPWNSAYRLRLAAAQLKAAQPAAAQPLLVALARDNSAPYATRVDAATLLSSRSAAEGVASAPATTDLGSRELDLLAANPHPALAAARQPYFAAARLAAASAPAVSKLDRAALLREAIAIDPSNQHALLGLLLSQTPADSASGTIALYNALAETPVKPSTEDSADADSDPAAGEEFSAEGNADPISQGFEADEPTRRPAPSDNNAHSFPTVVQLLVNSLDRPTQIRLATLLASAYNRDGNPERSLFFDQLAVSIDAENGKADPVLLKRLHDFEAAQELERKNAARRPLIHAAVDQPHNVRPRLTSVEQPRAEAP